MRPLSLVFRTSAARPWSLSAVRRAGPGPPACIGLPFGRPAVMVPATPRPCSEPALTAPDPSPGAPVADYRSNRGWPLSVLKQRYWVE